MELKANQKNGLGNVLSDVLFKVVGEPSCLSVRSCHHLGEMSDHFRTLHSQHCHFCHSAHFISSYILFIHLIPVCKVFLSCTWAGSLSLAITVAATKDVIGIGNNTKILKTC